MTRGKKCSLAAILVIMVAYGRYRYTAAIGPSPVVLQNDPSVTQPVFTITEKAPTRAFSWLKAATTEIGSATQRVRS